MASRANQPTIGGEPSGIRVTEPKSTTASRPSGRSRKLPGCGSVCSRWATSGAEKWNSESSRPAVSRSSREPRTMIVAERSTGHPFGNHEFRCAGHHPADEDLRIVGVGAGERALVVGLRRVVDLFQHPGAQLVKQRLELDARQQRPDQPAQSAELGEVGGQRFGRPGVLQLDCHLASVAPDGAVHLPDTGGRSRRCRRNPRTRTASRCRAAPTSAGAPGPVPSAGRCSAAWPAPRDRAQPGPPEAPPRTPTAPGRTSSRRP